MNQNAMAISFLDIHFASLLVVPLGLRFNAAHTIGAAWRHVRALLLETDNMTVQRHLPLFPPYRLPASRVPAAITANMMPVSCIPAANRGSNLVVLAEQI